MKTIEEIAGYHSGKFSITKGTREELEALFAAAINEAYAKGRADALREALYELERRDSNSSSGHASYEAVKAMLSTPKPEPGCEWSIKPGDEQEQKPRYLTQCGKWYRVTDDGADTCPNCKKTIHHTPIKEPKQ